MSDLMLFGVPAVIVIIGLVEVAKHAGFPARWAGLLAAVIGTAGGAIGVAFAGSEVIAGAVQGLAAALVASGIYSGGKAALDREPDAG